MERKRLKRVSASLVAAALLIGMWLSSRLLPAWSPDGHAGGSAPKAVLSCQRRDLGSVPQGRVLQATFPVTNAGNRRLILSQRGTGCCGRPADSHQVIVAPGDSTELSVEVDTARWAGQLDHTVRYTTNDPALPQFALRVTALVESPPRPPLSLVPGLCPGTH